MVKNMSKNKQQKNSADPDLFAAFKQRELELVGKICKTIALEYGLPTDPTHPATPHIANALLDAYTAGYARALEVNDALESISDELEEEAEELCNNHRNKNMN